MTGVAGYIAPRHLRAVKETGNRLVAAIDPHDAVGVLDQFSFDTRFFSEIERFDRHLEKLRRGPESGRVHYVSICSPNYLHDAHVRLALRVGADAICEKPLVINPWNLDALEEIERETGRRVFTILQLRVHPDLLALKSSLDTDRRHQVVLTYVTARGSWYGVSWKGQEDRSGGVTTNIGIHFFDLLLWLFGPIREVAVHAKSETKGGGLLVLENADVQWFLSTDIGDLPDGVRSEGRTTYRSITVDGQEVEFSGGFTNLHTVVYAGILEGQGHGIADARPAIELAHRIRQTPVSPCDRWSTHPFVRRLQAVHA